MSLYGGINFGAQATPPVIEAAPTIATAQTPAVVDANSAVESEGKAKRAYMLFLHIWLSPWNIT